MADEEEIKIQVVKYPFFNEPTGHWYFGDSRHSAVENYQPQANLIEAQSCNELSTFPSKYDPVERPETDVSWPHKSSPGGWVGKFYKIVTLVYAIWNQPKEGDQILVFNGSRNDCSQAAGLYFVSLGLAFLVLDLMCLVRPLKWNTSFQ